MHIISVIIMVVLTKRGKVKRPLLSRRQAGFSPSPTSTKSPGAYSSSTQASANTNPPTTQSSPTQILPRGVVPIDVVYWTAVAKTVESSGGITLERVELIPAEVLVTDGRTDWILDISHRAREIAERAGYHSPT